MANPKNFKIPTWFLNRQRDWKDGKDGQMTSNNLDNKLREDIERMKNPTPSRYPTLVGLPSQRSKNQNQWSTRSNLRCSPKEVNNFFGLKFLFNICSQI